MKSQMQRIRRLCSKDTDYIEAIELLKKRCISSGYKNADVEIVFNNYQSLSRNLYDDRSIDTDDYHQVRLVVLSGTVYQSDIELFAKRMNRELSSSKIKVSIVKTTGPSPVNNVLTQEILKFRLLRTIGVEGNTLFQRESISGTIESRG